MRSNTTTKTSSFCTIVKSTTMLIRYHVIYLIAIYSPCSNSDIIATAVNQELQNRHTIAWCQ